jgi:kynurenine 3-monooxygenase
VIVHYEHALVDIDFEKRVASFEDKQKKGSKIQVDYDLLIGADGSKSMTRTLMDQSESVTDFSVVRTEVDSMEYQVAILPKCPTFDSQLPADTVHTWNNKKYNAICLAFPLVSGEGGLLFALVFPQGKLEEFQKSHQSKTGDGYQDALESLFPDLSVADRDELIRQLAQGKPANGGLCVWNSSLGSASKGVALVGDSGHGMWPSLGQGANCALETAGIFSQTCRDIDPNAFSSSADWSHKIIEGFNQRRHVDASAAVDLTYGGIGARKCRGRGNSPLSCKLQIGGMMLMHKMTLGLVPKPVMLRLMMGEIVPYNTARKWNFYYEKALCLSALGLIGLPFLAYYRKGAIVDR